tara:strand:+ start:29071 stop:29649 length:579 start_codon:yes stop_codon:yes gene_type:complete
MSQETPFIIYAESTPNPTVMKFVSNKVLTTISKEALNVDETSNWPLLKKIFSFPFVQEIFISNNYISIKKHEVVKWDAITNQVRIFIQEQLNNGVKIVDLHEMHENDSLKKNTKSEFEKEVENIININIKPNIQMDGGDIELVSCENKIVKVFLKGACSGCPSSQLTLKSGIEVLLKEAFPNQIDEVIAING